MKTNKILYAALIAGATLGTVTSCSDSFLDEKLITEKGTAYFQTKEGIDDLVTGAYQKLKFKYNYIWGIYLYGMGIDEFTSGANNITSYGNGLFIYNRKEDELQHFSTADKDPLFHSNFLLSVFIDRSGCIWICTGDGVYCCRELKDLNTEHVKIEPASNREWSNYVRHISNIGNDRLAVTTRANMTYIYNTRPQQRTVEMQQRM